MDPAERQRASRQCHVHRAGGHLRRLESLALRRERRFELLLEGVDPRAELALRFARQLAELRHQRGDLARFAAEIFVGERFQLMDRPQRGEALAELGAVRIDVGRIEGGVGHELAQCSMLNGHGPFTILSVTRALNIVP
jgi:hypothetical protein